METEVFSKPIAACDFFHKQLGCLLISGPFVSALRLVYENKPQVLTSNERFHALKLMHNGLQICYRSPEIPCPQVQLAPRGKILYASLSAVVLFTLTGCNRDEITSYRVPKEKPAELAASHVPMRDETAPGQVQWITPAGWTELPASAMRVGAFKISTNRENAEVSIIPLAGVSGIELESVNMWRQSLGLTALDSAAFSKVGGTVPVGDTEARIFDMAGAEGNSTNKNRTIGAIANHDGTLWFFKITGDDHLVAQEKPAFQQFLKSITFSHASPPEVAGGDNRNRAMGPLARKMPETSVTSGKHSAWKTPDGWIEQPAPSMILASYSAPGKDGTKADVTVSMFPGDVGGVLANVNRWRRQLSLPAITETELPQNTSGIQVGGTEATLVDMTKAGGPKGMLAVIVPREGNTWFYKMMGDPAVLADQKKAFLEFAAIAH